MNLEKQSSQPSKEEVYLNIDEHPIFLQSYSWKKDEGYPVRLGLIFLIKLHGEPSGYKIEINTELSNFGWFTLEESKKMNEEDNLIGKDSPTGTFG